MSSCFALSQADEQNRDLQKRLENVKSKFSGVLNYFGEDPQMTSVDFFTTLDRFVLVSLDFGCVIILWLIVMFTVPVVGVRDDTRCSRATASPGESEGCR